MTTGSFSDISSHNWQPVTLYQSVQAQILEEVNQGLWANQARPDDWCCVQTSASHGAGNSWVTHTYQTSNATKTATVVWPVGWPAPAENINGELPSHFFATSSAAMPGAQAQPLSQATSAPASQPTYKPAGLCM